MAPMGPMGRHERFDGSDSNSYEALVVGFFGSFSRPVLHMAARVVQEMGKSRAAAFAVGLQDIDEGAHVNSFAETADSHDSDTNENSHSEGCIWWFRLLSFFYIVVGVYTVA
nr:hypothetical protein CFP56_26221 [Quercus suber]